MEVINAIGRRKSSVARIYMTEGEGSHRIFPLCYPAVRG